MKLFEFARTKESARRYTSLRSPSGLTPEHCALMKFKLVYAPTSQVLLYLQHFVCVHSDLDSVKLNSVTRDVQPKSYEMLSVTPRATHAALELLNFPCASINRYTHGKHDIATKEYHRLG